MLTSLDRAKSTEACCLWCQWWRCTDTEYVANGECRRVNIESIYAAEDGRPEGKPRYMETPPAWVCEHFVKG